MDDRSVDKEWIMSLVQRRFNGRAYIGAADVASLVGMSMKTLKRHIDLGHIRFSSMGHGRKKIRRIFTENNVALFCLHMAGLKSMDAAPRTHARQGSSARNSGR